MQDENALCARCGEPYLFHWLIKAASYGVEDLLVLCQYNLPIFEEKQN